MNLRYPLLFVSVLFLAAAVILVALSAGFSQNDTTDVNENAAGLLKLRGISVFPALFDVKTPPGKIFVFHQNSTLAKGIFKNLPCYILPDGILLQNSGCIISIYDDLGLDFIKSGVKDKTVSYTAAQNIDGINVDLCVLDIDVSNDKVVGAKGKWLIGNITQVIETSVYDVKSALFFLDDIEGTVVNVEVLYIPLLQENSYYRIIPAYKVFFRDGEELFINAANGDIYDRKFLSQTENFK